MLRLKQKLGNGDVLGPSSSTDNAITRFDGTTGKVIQNSAVIIEDTTGNIDSPSAGGTLSLSQSNAIITNIGKTGSNINLTGSTINIGESGATINIIGSTHYSQVTNLQVADLLVTLNKGGGASSASGSGFELEENSLITGYIKTSADRNSYLFKAPNTAGITTITTGATDFTIDNTIVKSSSGSSVDNTIARFDSTTGKLIQSSGIVIDDSNNLSSVVDIIASGNLSCANLIATGTTTLNTGLTGPLKATSGIVSAAAIDLTSEITGTLPIANGGTGQTAKTAAMDALSPCTTRGDLIIRDASNNIRLPIGAANTLLKSDGTDPSYGLIVNANVDASAAIAYSKLNLSSSIVNADVATAAAVTRSKLASGSNNYVVINNGSGVMSEEQYLDKTRGGTGITSTATFPSSGTINTGTGTNNIIAKFTSAGPTIGDSSLSDSGSLVTSTSDIMLNAQQELRLGDSDSSHYVGFKSPATVTTSQIYTLPTDDGTNGNVLKTDGSGNLDWVSNVGAASLSTKTANYTITTSDNIIIADATSNDVTLTLPASSGNSGVSFEIHRKDATAAYEVIIDGNGSETIDGDTTKIIKGQYNSIRISCDGSNWYSTATGNKPIAYIKDLKSSGTVGGAGTAATYVTRDLNTTSGNTEIVSLSSNVFTLQVGEYDIYATVPAFNCNGNKAKLVRDPDGTPSDEIIGSIEYSAAGNNATSNSIIEGNITVTASTEFEIQHRINTQSSTEDFGYAGGYGDSEVYTQVKITKVK